MKVQTENYVLELGLMHLSLLSLEGGTAGYLWELDNCEKLGSNCHYVGSKIPWMGHQIYYIIKFGIRD